MPPTRFGLWLSNRLRLGRGTAQLRPVSELTGLGSTQLARIAALGKSYGVGFERRMSRADAIECYVYLDFLDRWRACLGGEWPLGRRVLDVGSKNFYYAAALHAALRPSKLTGLELEGYRLFPNLHSRHDYALAHIRGLANTEYQVGDIRSWDQAADVITCFYPFVSLKAHKAWGLPAAVFEPQAQFQGMARLLPEDGWLLMVNQGAEEASRAADFARAVGLKRFTCLELGDPLAPRPLPPVLSAWQPAAAFASVRVTA